jgi:Uma2 family endonuclease
MTRLPATAQPREAATPRGSSLPPLESGDHLDQRTFHERYEAMPEDVRAELIGGVVYMPSPLQPPHGRMHAKLMGWLSDYEEPTPGVELYDNPTAILGPQSEPQPDAYLIVSPDRGGQTRLNDRGYLEGPPEFIAEIASSADSMDLHGKRTDYERASVREYLVIVLRQARVLWLVLRNGRFDELAPGTDGILRSEAFPGLWLDPAALLRIDTRRVLEVLRQGLASPEHGAFVSRLTSRP